MPKKDTIGVVAGRAAMKNGVVPYAQLPNWIMALPISGDAKVLYAFLHSLAMKFKNNVFPEYATIAAEISIGARSISRHLNTLETVGAIERQQRRNKQRRTSNLYTVNVIPPDDLEDRIRRMSSKAWRPREQEAF